MLLTLGTACTNGAIRLTNGTTPNEGRVEYCYGQMLVYLMMRDLVEVMF